MSGLVMKLALSWFALLATAAFFVMGMTGMEPHLNAGVLAFPVMALAVVQLVSLYSKPWETDSPPASGPEESTRPRRDAD